MDFPLTIECDSLLGAGTSGKVYRVKSSADGKNYAIKRVTVASDDELELAKVEVRLHSLFLRASIVAYRYSWVERGASGVDLIMLLDLVDGELWAALLETPPSAAECAAWSSALLDALQAVHGLQIVHRDLSPWNAFVSTDAKQNRTLQLGDFGLAARCRA